MLTRAALALVAVGVCVTAAAQTPSQELPKSQVPTLGRPTKPEDPAPVLDFWLYFKGAWAVTWDYPESPLAPADVLTGTTVYTQVSPTRFTARTDAENSGGKVTISETLDYQRDQHQLTRAVTDSRGFSYTQTGTVAGDLGGQFTIRLEGAPFSYKGQTIRINSVLKLLSPFNYRTQYHISVDGGPLANYGNPWSRKESSR